MKWFRLRLWFFYGRGRKKTVFIRISTKGNSENIKMNTKVYCVHFHSIAYKSLTKL